MRRASPFSRDDQVPGKRQEADVSTAPTRMLKRSTLVSAGRAPRASSQLIARGVRSPPDDGHGAGDRRGVSALLAIQPEPGRGAMQVAEGRGGARGLHGRDWIAVGQAERSSRYPFVGCKPTTQYNDTVLDTHGSAAAAYTR
jgi:hypothetical protein